MATDPLYDAVKGALPLAADADYPYMLITRDGVALAQAYLATGFNPNAVAAFLAHAANTYAERSRAARLLPLLLAEHEAVGQRCQRDVHSIRDAMIDLDKRHAAVEAALAEEER